MPKCDIPIAPQGAAPLPQTFFQGAPGTPKSTQKCIKTHGGGRCAKVWPQSGHGGRKGCHGGPKGPQKVQKTRPGAPRGRLFGTLGSKCAPSQNISIYYVLATFPRPGGSCPAPRAPKVAPMEHSLQQWTQKWCQRCPGGRPGSARGGHLDAKGAKRCPKM